MCGGYDFENPGAVWRELDRFHAEVGFTALLQGGGSGVDRFAREWAATHPEIDCYVCRAHWQKYGAMAAPRRNSHMMQWKPDLVIAFAGGSSTADMIKQATAAGVPVRHAFASASKTRRR